MLVDLYDPSGQSRGGATTSGGGKYSFYNLPAGPYRLKFNLPPEPGLSFTARDQGTDDTVDSDVDASGAYTDFFTVPPGDADRTRDAGLAPRRAVTGFAYSDDDGDGRRTDADAPLPALAVFSDDNANGAFDPGEAWTTTYGDGGYSLQLTPGTHLIAVATPPGRTLTTPPDARTVTVASGDVVGGLDLAVAPAPRATHLYVRGARWQPAFRQALAAAGLGDAAYGFEVTDPARPADVPWANIDQVSVRFDAPAAPDSTSLAAYGVRVPGYAINGYRYDADTNTGTWSLSAPLGTDRDRFELPGFQRRLAVLVGDANGDGKTNALDILEMRRRLNSTAAAGAGYRVFADIDGSGRIDARDLAVARLDRSSALPPEPASVSATGVAGATTDLFSRAPVLPT